MGDAAFRVAQQRQRAYDRHPEGVGEHWAGQECNGVIDASSGATGAAISGPNVSTGSLTTKHAPDLLLGNLLLTNAQVTPQS